MLERAPSASSAETDPAVVAFVRCITRSKELLHRRALPGCWRRAALRSPGSPLAYAAGQLDVSHCPDEFIGEAATRRCAAVYCALRRRGAAEIRPALDVDPEQTLATAAGAPTESRRVGFASTAPKPERIAASRSLAGAWAGAEPEAVACAEASSTTASKSSSLGSSCRSSAWRNRPRLRSCRRWPAPGRRARISRPQLRVASPRRLLGIG
jgi:hypothetical protein